MAELADAADSKSAGTWYLGGSIPPPGTTRQLLRSGFRLRALAPHPVSEKVRVLGSRLIHALKVAQL